MGDDTGTDAVQERQPLSMILSGLQDEVRSLRRRTEILNRSILAFCEYCRHEIQPSKRLDEISRMVDNPAKDPSDGPRPANY